MTQTGSINWSLRVFFCDIWWICASCNALHPIMKSVIRVVIWLSCVVLGISSRIGLKSVKSVKSNHNDNAAYNGVTMFEPTVMYSARDVTKNKRVPFIFLAGFVGSRGWGLGSSGDVSAAGSVSSPGSSLLCSEFGMLWVVIRSGRMEDCMEFLLFLLREWFVECGGWARGKRGGEGALFEDSSVSASLTHARGEDG